MREILFRGKRHYDDKWIEGSLVKINNGEHIILPYEICERDGHHLFIDSDDSLFVKDETIGQFTGLTDKNGVKIFEGDIIETKNGKYIWKSLIVFFRSSCAFMANTIYRNFNIDEENEDIFGDYYFNRGKIFTYMPNSKEAVIIGNIHDNPELVKEEKTNVHKD